MKPLHILAMLAMTSAATPARATITQVIGGPGGAPFTMECPAGQAAVGVHARAGSWVDGVGLLCKPAVGNMAPVGWAGGPGGGPQEVYCAAGQYVTGIFLTFTRGNDLPRQFVNTIGITCGTEAAPKASAACILSGDTYDNYMLTKCSWRTGGGGILTQLHVSADELDCPAGEVLTGLHGRYGNHVDALGAICGARPQIALLPLPIKPAPQEPIKVTGQEIGRDVPIGNVGAVINAPVTSPAQIPPDPIKPGVVTPIMIPGVLAVDRCKSGYVWREASPQDHVCVTPESRSRVAQENAVAGSRVNPAGAYGPNTCISGFVWREAFAGDLVCVTPEVRALVREENAQAAVRKL